MFFKAIMTELFKNISSCDDVERIANNNSSENAVPNEVETTVLPFVVKAPRADSKLILKNMEEVLNSVKRKHKQKHKRLKEQKKRAQMEAKNFESDLKSKEMKQMNLGDEISNELKECPEEVGQKDKSQHKNALKEKVCLDNGLSTHAKNKQNLKRSPSKLATLIRADSSLKLYQKTPNKDEELEVCLPKTNNTMKANAFQVMMNARCKTIGSNTPGKEPSKSPNSEEISSNNAKRKVLLQEWAERKSGGKRKIEEESREAYIEHQLEQRAKRLKQMLVNGASPKSSTNYKQNSNEKVTERYLQSISTKKSRKRGRPPKIRCGEDIEDNIEVFDEKSEDDEFLSKLNSPTKKRDSLLAYFPKKQSPSQLAEKTKKSTENTFISVLSKIKDLSNLETPKRRHHRRHNPNPIIGMCDLNDTKPKNDNLVSNEDIPKCSATRPKRSCTGKTRCDYDQDISPVKTDDDDDSGSILTPVALGTESKKSKEFKGSSEDPDVIVLDDSSFNETSNKVIKEVSPPHKRLAPLFLKSVPKPYPDPVILKARQEFLRSGVPEKLRLEQIRQKQFEQIYEDSLELFPKIAHIYQYSNSEIQFLQSFHTQKVTGNLKAIVSEEFELTSTIHLRSNKRRSKSKAYIFGLITDCSNRDYKNAIQKKLHYKSSDDFVQLTSLENKRNIVKSWKSSFDRFPTYKCYNQMREKYRYFSAVDSEQDTEQFSESLVVTRRTRRSLEHQKDAPNGGLEEDAKPPPTAPNGELLFTEKYKPLMFEQVLVNLTPVTQLKEFLSSWAFGNNGTPRNSQNLEDSIDFANDSNSSHTSSCNSVVLLGPVSSGKTNAVFALANEMNFNVLEINAGMKRTGKKLIQELQEATQSHQIKKESKSQKHLLKMSLNGLKRRKSVSLSTNVSNGICSMSNSSQSQENDASLESGHNVRKCLILIEDADIVFDQTDSGFIDAIYTLAASSKRPVIAVASNPSCSHLQRLMQQHTIVFNPPNVLNIAKYLSILSLIENCPILLDDIISLHLYNKKDLRRTMNELQFFIQSGGDRCRHWKTNKNGSQKPKTSNAEAYVSFTAISNTNFFASPAKRRFSEEASNEKFDDKLERSKIIENQNVDEVYMHQCLFKFYTNNQNAQWRIPFPVNFESLRINLNDILQNAFADKMNVPQTVVSLPASKTKRTSRSPKKEWINAATATATTALVNASKESKMVSIKTMCKFYENISTAAFITECCSNRLYGHTDRLVQHFSEEVSHTLVENTISLTVEAKNGPYNLFESPETKRVCLTDNLGSIVIRTNRSRFLDFEPGLRAICRSEKLRAAQERRSTRFYHYLRNVCLNASSFSTDHYDEASNIFQSNIDDTQVQNVHMES